MARFGKVISVSPDIVAAAYASGDVVGTVREIPLAVDQSGGCAKLRSLVVTDAGNVKAKLDLLFFSEAPANSIGIDNAAYALNDADLPKLIGRISVLDTDYVSSGSANAEATLRNLELILQAKVKTKSIWVATVARGAATYAASDLQYKLGLEQF